MIGTTKV